MADQPPAQGNKHKRQRMILIGAAAVGLLVLLYLRSQGQNSPNATSSTDLQTASMSAAQQQAAQDAAMYGSSSIPGGGGGGIGGGGGVDPTAITDAITQGFNTVAQSATPPDAMTAPSTPADTPAAPAPVAITINTAGQPAGRGRPGGGAQVAQITTHRGGPFYDWYQQHYHHAPPAHISNQDPRYLAWARPRVRPRSRRR